VNRWLFQDSGLCIVFFAVLSLVLIDAPGIFTELRIRRCGEAGLCWARIHTDSTSQCLLQAKLHLESACGGKGKLREV